MKNLSSLLLLFALFLSSCNDDDTQIDLPAAIQSYLDNNYPDAEIEESEIGVDCDGTAIIEVEVEENDDEEIELVFSASEEVLLYSETEIRSEDLPAAVSSSVATNYPDYSTEEADQLNMADGSTQYEVEIKNGSSKLEVTFGADGEVLCEEEDGN